MTSIQYTQVEEIPKIVNRLRKTFDSGINIPLKRRKSILKKMYDSLLEMELEIADALKKDLNKDYQSAVGSEIVLCLQDIGEILEHLDEWAEDHNVPKDPIVNMFDTCQVRYQPFGVVCIIAPWNFPFLLTIAPLISAIGAGNVVVLKPSEVSSNTAAIIEKFIKKLNVDEIKVVNGAVKETTVLLEQRFDHIFYTGNGQVARIIMKAATKHLTPVVLELGGKSPVVITKEVDIELCARRVWWAKCSNAGQICIAPDYVLCPKELVDKFVQACLKTQKEFYGEDISKAKNFGRIISNNHWNRITTMLKKQLEVPGSKVVFGGDAKEEELFIAPTIVTGVGQDSETNPLMGQEIFGPILPIIAMDSTDEAIEYIKSGEKPLALYVFSKDKDLANHIVNSTSSGGAMINDLIVNMVCTGLPFGGVGESGMGNYHGKFGFECFSHKRSIMIRPHGLEFMNASRYPNATDKMFNFARKMIQKPKPTAMKLFLARLIRQRAFKMFWWTITVVGAFMIGHYAR